MGEIHLRPSLEGGKVGGRRRGDEELRALALKALEKGDLDEVLRLFTLSNSYKRRLKGR